ncbi:hypothetical protein [Maribacter litoralis]|uniref:hypothetical protein n=1 Tax=Maribacter litoralis TaxID=2059726 RepID=UPI000E317254|nr:hypothetical protein [Maribacter litoralis]
MHENLKYTIRLTKDIKTCSNIKNINSLEIKDWQPIFADKEYDSFYFIYAKFIGEREENNDSFSIQRIQLYVQNYEGDITIGLTGKAYFYQEDLDVVDCDSRYKERKQYGLFIILQGFNANLSTVIENDIIFPIEGKWTSTPKINTGDILVTRIYFQPISLHLRDTSDNKTPVVLDRLFQARDGDSIIDIERQDRLDIENLKNKGVIDHLDYEEIFKDLKKESFVLQGVRRRCSPIISFFTIE